MKPKRQPATASAISSDSENPNPDNMATIRSTEDRIKKPLLHNDGEEHTVTHVAKSPGRLSRTLLNFWLDAALGLVFAVLCVVAVIVQFVFPPGVATRGVSLWSMSYGQWCSLQFGLLALLTLGILVHVMLHWIWVCSVVAKRILKTPQMPDDGIRTIYGVGLLITLLLAGAAAVGLAQWMIVFPD